MFGALLQSVTDAAAVAAPSIQGAALALVLPVSTATGQQTGEQQDTAAVAPALQAPWLLAPTATTVQPGTSNTLPDIPVPASTMQQSANPQNAVVPPQTADVPVLTSATVKDNASPLPAPLPEIVSNGPAPAPQQSSVPPATTTVAPPATTVVVPQPEKPPTTELPLPVALAPEPAPVQPAPQTAAVKPVQLETEPSAATSPGAALIDQIPTPRDPAAVTVKPATSKTKLAVEPQPAVAKADDATSTNPIVDVLAGFLLPQIEPIAAPANDRSADTIDPAFSTKSDNQDAPVAAVPDQNSTVPNQPTPIAMVQPPPVSVPVPTSAPANDAIAPAVIGQAPPPKNNSPTDEPGTPGVAQKTAARQQPGHQTGPERVSNSAPVFVPANDTAPDSKTDLQPQVAPETRTASAPDTPQPVQPSMPSPAPHQMPAAIANPAVPTAAPSGLRKLTAGLQVAMQEQETTSSIDKLGLTIATKSIDGLRHFDIRLDPPELGRVQVQLTTDDAGRSQANVVVDKPQTLELLQRDAQNLNRALHEAGLDVSNNGLNFSLREQFRQTDGGVDQGRGRSLSVQAVVQTDATEIHASLGSYAPNSVRLDIRV